MRALARRGGITRAARDASPAPVRGRAAAADSAKSRRPLAPHAERDDRPIRRVT
ncbi:2'-5' RNA ligase, partial [Burkholderia pseudomallei]